MSKLPVISGKRVIHILRKCEFYVDRQRGSHVVLIKRTPEKVIRLTVPAHEVVARGTLRNIIKQAQLTREEFIKLSQE